MPTLVSMLQRNVNNALTSRRTGYFVAAQHNMLILKIHGALVAAHQAVQVFGVCTITITVPICDL